MNWIFVQMNPLGRTKKYQQHSILYAKLDNGIDKNILAERWRNDWILYAKLDIGIDKHFDRKMEERLDIR